MSGFKRATPGSPPPEGNKISLRCSLRGSPRSCAKADRFRRAQGLEGGLDPPKLATGWFHQVFSFSGLMIVRNSATKRLNSLILTRLIRSGSCPESHPLIERRDTLRALASIS